MVPARNKNEFGLYSNQKFSTCIQTITRRYMQRYLRTMQCVDDNVGRMLDWLDEEGLSENTGVVYTSDQGFFLGEQGWCDKRFMYEESFQIPFLVRYPKMIRPGSMDFQDIICNVDFAPTFCDLAGLEVPSYVQGVSFRPLLLGQARSDWQWVVYRRYWMHNDACHNAYAHYSVRNQRHKLIYWYHDDLGIEGAIPGGTEPEWELFDSDEDPLELLNIYHDPKYKDVVKEMTVLLEAKMMEIGDVTLHPRFQQA